MECDGSSLISFRNGGVNEGMLTKRLVTSAESRECDRYAIEELQIPSLVLMENAALSIVEVLEKHLDVQPGQCVVVVAGRGNNGGDGMAIARHLRNRGVDVRVYLTAHPDELKGDASANCSAVRAMGIPLNVVTDATELSALERALRSADVVVDALLGTGITGEVRGIIADVIPIINAHARCVLSVDVPSGLNADTGAICGVCVNAHTTVTLGAIKRGLLLFPGAEYVGDLFLGYIGVPMEIFEALKPVVQLTTDELVHKCFPPRKLDSHKGNYGRVLVVGGCAGMTGAAMMCGISALRAGAGLVTVALPQSLNSAFEASIWEVMSLPLPETPEQTIAPDALDVLLERIGWADVLAVGPGISRHADTQAFVRQLVSNSSKPIVLDADGIMAFSGRMTALAQHAGELVITPHPGEMAGLLKCSVAEVQADRIGIAQRVAQEINAVVVLKGARTVIAAPNGDTYVNLTGNPGLASGGTGDVLTGLIAGLIAQGNNAFDASACGAFLHGLSGDIASWEKGEVSLIAGDLIEHLPRAILQPDLWLPVSVRPLSARVWFVYRMHS